MLGAIIGDVVGSVYEFDNIKTKEFELFGEGNSFTDDTVMTVAVAKALIVTLENPRSFKEELITQMHDLGKRYPNSGYGGMFRKWLIRKDRKPYNSFGNGSAMRVSPCGYIAVTLDEALELARISAEVTHNHPEGIKGAQATAVAIFLARCGKSKDEIKQHIEENFYVLDKNLEEIRPTYSFNETCQDTVPQAIQAFLESTSFEDAIRNAISIGGDSDTLAAITGSIAWAYYMNKDCVGYDYKLNQDLKQIANKVYTYLPQEFIDSYEKIDMYRWMRYDRYYRWDTWMPILDDYVPSSL
jgi:type I restriction enzyme M protein